MSTCVLTLMTEPTGSSPDDQKTKCLGVVLASPTEPTPAPTTSLPPSSPTSPLGCQNRVRHINQLHRRMSRISSTTLSDLIPLATVALKEQQKLEAHEDNDNDNDNDKEHKEDPSKQQQYQTTALARAVTKVKVQLQAKRLKERYLGHEWIRLALDLPVDGSGIHLNGQTRFIIKETSTLPLSPASLCLLTSNPSSIPGRRIALKSLEGRTCEIAAWYEWKFDKSKWTIEDIDRKVDRLRKLKIEHQHTITTTTATTNKSLCK